MGTDNSGSREVPGAEAPKDKSFSQLLDRIFCPICGSQLSIEAIDGKRKLKCSQHGMMKRFLDQDPRAPAAVAEACDAIGVKDLEVC